MKSKCPRLRSLLLLGLSVWLMATGIGAAQAATRSERSRWQREAQATTITRDDWGIAHVHGQTDADAVFGMIYAQAEDDFNRVETNYLASLGPTGRGRGRDRDLAGPAPAAVRRSGGPEAPLCRAARRGCRQLMNAWADGLNFYLATHPDVHPRVITHFEPWMALSFTEGSIGGDIERVDLKHLEAFYGQRRRCPGWRWRTRGRAGREPTGSNGIAIAPSLTVDGHALLLINPHTSFFFRSELQMTSDEGLDAYGAVTWGQFFIYQGFNEHVGWMHTSTGADAVDEFAETIVHKDGRLFYRYGSALRPVTTRVIRLRYREPDGSLGERSFTVYCTHHGPIVRRRTASGSPMALMNSPIEALEQSWLRTKAHDLRQLHEGRRAAGQLVQQHGLRRRRGRDRLPAAAVHSRARRPLRLHPAGRRQRSGHRLAGADAAGRDCRTW